MHNILGHTSETTITNSKETKSIKRNTKHARLFSGFTAATKPKLNDACTPLASKMSNKTERRGIFHSHSFNDDDDC